MHEVIIERPRWGHAARYPRARMRRRAGDYESAPTREPMGRTYRDKSLEENLAPLRRFLRSRVGKPWSAVRSEIAEHLRVTSAVQKHVMDHVREYVSETSWIGEDGEVYTLFRGLPRRVGPTIRPRFYVHPVTGRLAMFPLGVRRATSDDDPNVREVSPTLQYRRIDGAWFEVTLAPLPESPNNRYRGLPVRDVVSGCIIRRWGPHDDEDPMSPVWRSGRYACAKRQLSKREIRELVA